MPSHLPSQQPCSAFHTRCWCLSSGVWLHTGLWAWLVSPAGAFCLSFPSVPFPFVLFCVLSLLSSSVPFPFGSFPFYFCCRFVVSLFSPLFLLLPFCPVPLCLSLLLLLLFAVVTELRLWLCLFQSLCCDHSTCCAVLCHIHSFTNF